MHVQESLENYLETILILNQRIGNVRSIDVVREMGFSKASVSVAMKNLRQKEYITMDREGFIKLTPEGLLLAAKVYERHTVVTDILVKLGVDEKIAAEDACRIEHVLSEESFNAIKNYVKSKKKHE